MSRQWGQYWWTKSGTTDTNVTNGINTIMHDFMTKYNVRYAQVAIGMGGAMCQGNYTFTPYPYEHITQVSDMFMLASVSKAFICAAIYKLMPREADRLNYLIFRGLGYDPAAAKDPRLNNINIQMLLDHTAGFDDGSNGPPPKSPTTSPDYSAYARQIAASIGKNVTTTQQIVDYVWKQDLNYTPFNDPNHGVFRYSNVGYLILSLVVEKISGKPYIQYLQDSVLTPLSIRCLGVPTLQKDYPSSGLITPEDSNTGLPSYDYQDTTTRVSTIYGGDDMIKETCHGNCTLAMSARDVVTFMNSYAIWGIGARSAGYERTGSWYGSSTMGFSSYSTTSGKPFDVAVVLNTRDWLPPANIDLGTALWNPMIDFLNQNWKGV